MAKQETIKVKEKDIVILRFDSSFPVTEPDLHAMMKTIRDAVNKDETIVNRFICLANGIDIETMGEEDFKSIWMAKWGEASFKKAQDELKELENTNPSQLDLFDKDDTSVEDIVQNNIPHYNPHVSSSDYKNIEEQEKPIHEDEVGNINDVLSMNLGGKGEQVDTFEDPASDEVELNKKDDDGNTWKPISEEDYEKARRGEL